MINNLIFLLNSPYPDYTGGRETWINNVCNRLADCYNITIVSQKKEWTKIDMGKFTDIDPRIRIVHVSTLSSKKIFSYFIHSYLLFVNKLVLACNMKRKTLKLIDPAQKYAVISMDTVFMAYTGRKISGQCANVFHIASSRGPHAEIYSQDYPLFGKLIMRMEKKNLSSADEIWANGGDTQKSILEKGFKSIVVRNGVDLNKAGSAGELALHDFCHIPKEDKIVVTIGTLQDVKGYRELIRALSILRSKYGTNLHLIGVGKGDGERYMQLAREMGVQDLVHFVGEQRNTIEYAKSADIVACVSGGGGLGMACLESMVSGKPIIAWESETYMQLIKDKESGTLIRTGDPESLAEGFHEILENYSECLRWAKQAFKNAQAYDWSNVVKDIVHSIKKLEKE